MPPHCDTMDGSVVTTAREALENKNANIILPWASEIALRVGETYRLELGGLSSAGYDWEYIIDPQGIAEVSTEMIGVIPQLPPGGPSPDTFERQKVFNITALESGTTQVRMFLRRSWEHDKPPLRELCLKILVSK